MLRTVVLAGGASSRMGRPKATLPLDGSGETFLSRIIRTALSAGLPEIVVVGGAHVEAARAAWPAADRRVQVLANTDWEMGQLSSLLVGIDAPAVVPVEAVLVLLVDVPLVTADTIKQVATAWRDSRAPIVRPARGDEHGHPVIFDCCVFAELRRADVAAGAKSVVRAHAGQIVNVPIDDPGAYRDIDTPAEYARILF
jgi:CTP:molybdopterin cytidylyltransferase MocA